jgi:pyruvate,water dikinase
MVRSDVGASGVLFTLDTESGFRDVVFVTSSYGLGEMVVQGAVNPGRVLRLQAHAQAGKPAILRRAGQQADCAWCIPTRRASACAPRTRRRRCAARSRFPMRTCRSWRSSAGHRTALRPPDGHRVGQGRPYRQALHPAGAPGNGEVARARRPRSSAITLKSAAKVLASEGRAIGRRSAVGPRAWCLAADMERVQPGDVLVADMTDPDWEPVMKRASAIVTNRGGRTCHAAIIARELGVPGRGRLRRRDRQRSPTAIRSHGQLRRRRYRPHLSRRPALRITTTRSRQHAAGAAQDHDERRQPGTRLRFRPAAERRASAWPAWSSSSTATSASIRRRCSTYDRLPDIKAKIDAVPAGYADPEGVLRGPLAEGIATITAAFAPNPVIVRLSDFKSNEYANLIGGEQVRAARRKPDDRLPRRLALHRPSFATASRWNAAP